jgi:hypothetical protein
MVMIYHCVTEVIKVIDRVTLTLIYIWGTDCHIEGQTLIISSVPSRCEVIVWASMNSLIIMI